MRQPQKFSERTGRPGWIYAGLVVGLLLLAALVGIFFIDEPLRIYLEERANAGLPGYHVTIGGLELHPLAVSAELRDVTLRRHDSSQAPQVVIPHITTTLQLSSIFSAMMIGDIQIDSPVVSVSQQQIERLLNKDRELVKAHVAAFQNRARQAMPFQTSLSIRNGHINIYGTGATEPLHLQSLSVTAANLTNRQEGGASHPVTWQATAGLNDQTGLEFDGQADVFASPLPKVDSTITAHRLRLTELMPVMQRYNVQIRSGELDLSGTLSQSGEWTTVTLDTLAVQQAAIDVVRPQGGWQPVQKTPSSNDKSKPASRNPYLRITVEHGQLSDSEFGFIDKATSREYRVFLSDTNVQLEHVSNRQEDGTATVELNGKFMGHGPTVIRGAIRPGQSAPDFDLNVRIIRTKVVSLNNVLQAYGHLDVTDGTFAFFSELSVRGDKITGYVKPFFKDVEIYDPQQDKEKALAQRAYEATVGGIVDLLKSDSRKEVATKTTVSGSIQDARIDIPHIIGKLIQNAFFNAVLPGLEKHKA
ncbi:hypothetical protein W02_10980 [Nitrospira sp. KM1]|uniref:DUF748 domain-containing protein n=1 Tax=Nitrospira sp. KM1 TaxID=1936990 RepID=UPI0013A75C83|nr:DUF748 domain-containing protein [Nitrospira sp. KM1]BCA53958.1 hypothetical protein W02_10980 [Nitrospira sp. KM1]